MELRTSLGYVSIRRFGDTWEARRRQYRASGSQLDRVLMFVGVPRVEIEQVRDEAARRLAAPARPDAPAAPQARGA